MTSTVYQRVTKSSFPLPAQKMISIRAMERHTWLKTQDYVLGFSFLLTFFQKVLFLDVQSNVKLSIWVSAGPRLDTYSRRPLCKNNPFHIWYMSYCSHQSSISNFIAQITIYNEHNNFSVPYVC